jgi:8-oxo-dGTP pyrophosphatase MutT (NUDIX family)
MPGRRFSISQQMPNRIIIAAALIGDGDGQLLLVRKRGTAAFMQAGGKLDPGETPFQALARELEEELGYRPAQAEVSFLGTFAAEAANEPDHFLEAHLFHLRAAGGQFRIAALIRGRIPGDPISRGTAALPSGCARSRAHPMRREPSRSRTTPSRPMKAAAMRGA